MANFLELTNSLSRAGASKITGQTVEAMQYSKPGQADPTATASQVARGILGMYRLSESEMKYLEADYMEIAADFAQLGLTVVGLLEVAEPVQAGADVLNGAIDISRGHPILGVLSMASALPIAGLIPGIGLAAVRIFQCAYKGLRFQGKCLIVLASRAGKAIGRFIYLNRGVLIKISDDGKRLWDATAELGEKMLKACKDFGEQMAKKPVAEKVVKNADNHFEPLDVILQRSMNKANDVTHRVTNRVQEAGRAIQQGRRNVDVYTKFPNTYGNITPFKNTFGL